MVDPGFNYCFCSWLVGRVQPGAGLSFAQPQSAKSSPLEVAPVETSHSWLGGLLAKKFNAKKDTAAGLFRETINATRVMLWVE